jgi:hypothetical protein
MLLYRWYFKEVDKKRSESAAPATRFKVEEENLEVKTREKKIREWRLGAWLCHFIGGDRFLQLVREAV